MIPSPERLHQAIHRRMLLVLYLDPVLLPAAAVGPVAMHGYQALKAELLTKMSFRCLARRFRFDL